MGNFLWTPPADDPTVDTYTIGNCAFYTIKIAKTTFRFHQGEFTQDDISRLDSCVRLFPNTDLFISEKGGKSIYIQSSTLTFHFGDVHAIYPLNLFRHTFSRILQLMSYQCYDNASATEIDENALFADTDDDYSRWSEFYAVERDAPSPVADGSTEDEYGCSAP